jgi:hypothetical protein
MRQKSPILVNSKLCVSTATFCVCVIALYFYLVFCATEYIHTPLIITQETQEKRNPCQPYFGTVCARAKELPIHSFPSPSSATERNGAKGFLLAMRSL